MPRAGTIRAARCAVVALLSSCLAGAALAADISGHEDDALRVQARLLDPAASREARVQALAQVQATADAGDAHARFVLGALYLSGKKHPAALVERDLGTARTWYERCVELPDCPSLAVAALVELELEAGDPRRAMQWAQIAAILEREVQKSADDGRERSQGYLPTLLLRARDALPAEARSQPEIDALTAAMVAERGAALDRMLERANRPDPELENMPRFAMKRRHTAFQGRKLPREDLLAEYLVEAPAAGGSGSWHRMIEGLPTPRAASALDRVAELMEFAPYTPPSGSDAVIVRMPLHFDTRRHSFSNSR